MRAIRVCCPRRGACSCFEYRRGMAPSQEVASQRRPGQRLLFSRVPQDGRFQCLLTYRARAGLGHDLEDCGDGWAVALEQHL